MWNADKSLTLSLVSVRIFFVIGIIFFIAGYPIAKQYVAYIHQEEVLTLLLVTGYICLIFAFMIFIELYRLLNNIRKNFVFCEQNTQHLRRLSWLCMVVAIVCLIAAFGYLTFLLVSIVFAFLALILRVIKNIIAEATRIKQENDFTI